VTTLVIGCGYLGERLGTQFRQKGECVLGTVRSPGRAAAIAALGIKPVIANVLEPASLRLLPDAERVFYCVGFDRSAGSTMRSVYVDGLCNVLKALPRSVERLVYASSTGVYGQTGGEWVDESSPAEAAYESGRVCLEAEQVVQNWASANEASAGAVILRFAGLYGPGRVVRRSILERGEPIPGDPQKYLNLIHVEDAARAAAAALEAGQPDPVYIVADDRPVTREEYYTRAASLLGASAPIFAPPQPGSAEAARDATNKRLSNGRIKRSLGVSFLYPDITTGLLNALERN
jgi:nucleoside-diphosphate-sugar epimerase